jgi:glycosyltransferase involved in cell wall biosynthesis
MFNKSFFKNEESLVEKIKNCDVIFVADMYSDEYLGGAEITTDVFYNSSKRKVCKIKCTQINNDIIEAGILKQWVFFNYASLNIQLIPIIVANLEYSIVEYDYKFCKYRSVEKHFKEELSQCNCHDEENGKMISSFMHAARKLFWMSEEQRDMYHDRFPFLQKNNNFILSSAFDKETLGKLKDNRDNSKERLDKALIVGSNSWIKGVSDSELYAKENKIKYDILCNVSHNEILEAMGKYKHFIFMPKGKDTCPRILIEAKLSGMIIHTNSNCQHTKEFWWQESLSGIEQYLNSHPTQTFWKEINESIDRLPTVSGYTTTRNCIEQKYPYMEAIKSMLQFCDQVVVVDGGSTDGTWESLVELSKKDDRIIINQNKRDWSHPRFAVFDGLQKAYARSLCTAEWCWQMDSDEVVHEDDYQKVKTLIKQMPKSMHLLALPVIEYWGGSEKVRIDVNPWKWRLSKNLPHITHGIPKQFRKYDEDNQLYAAQGTDGCDYINTENHDIIPCVNFYNRDIHIVRMMSLEGNDEHLEVYENWFNNLINQLPCVHHYSWYNLERKIKTYKNYWSKHWQSLYDIKQEDIPENNMFFDKKWSDVTEDEITELAQKLKDKMGGWVFHNKVDFEKPTPHVYIEREEPKIMSEK